MKLPNFKFDSSKFDKKTTLTLIAFIFVGIILIALIIIGPGTSGNTATENGRLNAANNTATEKGAYYGKEAIAKSEEFFYDKNGNSLDLSTLTKETELYDKNGKKINLPTIDSAEYKKIKKGMSYDEVCKIIGGKGEIVSEVDKPGDKYYTVCYFFYGDKAETSASFIFQGDRLKSKANTGIESKKK